MKKIIFDTDIGVDDAFALAYAAKCADIIGITAVFGNVPVEQVVSNARLFSQKIGLDVPIYRGCSRPLALPPTPPATAVHGDDGLGGVFANPYNGAAPNAIDFIINSVRANPDALTIVAVGPLTNIAQAINQAPDIVPQIKEVVIMGGAFGTHGYSGNVTPFAEFNIWKDPHAADQVLNSGLPVVVLPLDVTMEVHISGDEIRALMHPVLEAISRGYLRYSQVSNGIEGMSLHDTLTIAYLHNPAWFGVTEAPVRVVTEGVSLGQTLRQLGSVASLDNPFAGSRAQKLCLSVDVERVKEHFLATLKL
ncbi:nucleoside hydrolase [Erwinia sorbitola]|uniref:Nucleoside hydrolase n=1 Tax=Erwinia sorbitola TaxID=2681984 RepID=A0A6I6ELF3_9GAMM|nr:nucleoside hydrolase [Erwinia sorbitola]MTD28160.1 nucleoside hydrolase [Erwinia sorbitola]QGU85849.1 nucleoside hydrolase [Erwinia sorbitola]